jgi:hypothetical protein
MGTSDEKLDEFRQALASDPTNLRTAERYWKALGSYEGHDLRSGRDVVQIYRAAALNSREGAVAFAQAYRELFEVSGEPPRVANFDTDLLHGLENWLQTATDEERSVIGWVLEKVANR